MRGLHACLGSWRVMVHADVFGVFTRQGGPARREPGLQHEHGHGRGQPPPGRRDVDAARHGHAWSR